MNKKILIFSIIMLSIALTSCGPSTTTTSNQNVDYHTGSQGLYMRFLPDTPPTKIYANSPMDIMIEYSNKGAYNIAGGRIYLSGFDTQYISPNPSMEPNLQAEGKSQFNPDGRLTQTVDFPVSQVTLPSGVDRITQTIKATACYDYMTVGSIEVCVDPKTTNTIKESICQVQPSYGGGTQGAPVAITRVEEEAYKGKIQFRIYFSNVGGGTVISRTALNDCHTTLKREDANKIEVESVEYSGRSMRCQPINPITLDDSGNGFIYCEDTIPTTVTDAYKTVLQVRLRYGYRSSISQNIEILAAP